MKYTKEYLSNVLKKHGYKPVTLVDGAWFSFATQLLMLEKIDKLLKKNGKSTE